MIRLRAFAAQAEAQARWARHWNSVRPAVTATSAQPRGSAIWVTTAPSMISRMYMGSRVGSLANPVPESLGCPLG